MSDGFLLSEEDIQKIECTLQENGGEWHNGYTVMCLISAIRDRDKTIAELKERKARNVDGAIKREKKLILEITHLREQNTIMREALETISTTGDSLGWMARNKARETLAKVKAIPREKTGVSTPMR